MSTGMSAPDSIRQASEILVPTTAGTQASVSDTDGGGDGRA